MFYTQSYNWVCQKEQSYYEYWLKNSPGNKIARHNLAGYYVREKDSVVHPDLKDEMFEAVQK